MIRMVWRYFLRDQFDLRAFDMRAYRSWSGPQIACESREQNRIEVGLWLVVAKTLMIADMAPGRFAG